MGVFEKVPSLGITTFCSLILDPKGTPGNVPGTKGGGIQIGELRGGKKILNPGGTSPWGEKPGKDPAVNRREAWGKHPMRGIEVGRGVFPE